MALLGLLLAYILIKQILGPIRQLALSTAPPDPGARVPDEVTALSSRVHSLIEDVDQAQIELERSQEEMAELEAEVQRTIGPGYRLYGPYSRDHWPWGCRSICNTLSPTGYKTIGLMCLAWTFDRPPACLPVCTHAHAPCTPGHVHTG